MLRRVRRLAVDEPLLREAGRLDVGDVPLRAADAIHIVTAERLEERDFVTYDRIQARAAEAVGLAVRSPGMDAGWWR